MSPVSFTLVFMSWDFTLKVTIDIITACGDGYRVIPCVYSNVKGGRPPCYLAGISWDICLPRHGKESPNLGSTMHIINRAGGTVGIVVYSLLSLPVG